MVNDEKPIEPPQSEASEKDEQLLSHLALIARVIQQQTNPPSQNHDKSLQKAFQEPAVLAALVTVLIGGIAATLITGIIQWRAGVREFEQGWLKARGDQALVSYREYLDQEQALIRRAYSLIGDCTSAADNLTGLMRKDWSEQFIGQGNPAVQKQKTEIITNFNTTRQKWESQKAELGLLMDYYHPGQDKVKSSWSDVQLVGRNRNACKK